MAVEVGGRLSEDVKDGEYPEDAEDGEGIGRRGGRITFVEGR